jgi:Ca-activated chloride channel homolog
MEKRLFWQLCNLSDRGILTENMHMKYILAGSVTLLFLVMSFVSRVSFPIAGIVKDAATGKVLKGVIVKVKGGATAVKTNDEGKFNLVIDGKNATLIFSAMGYVTVQQKVNEGDKQIEVQLAAVVNRLEELVVVGYGTEKDMSKDMAVAQTAAPAAVMLQGRVPGLSISTASRRKQHFPHEYERQPHDREGYDAITENNFKAVSDDPLSTFSIDVDAASYSNVRRMLSMGQLPPAGAVRIEEMINYFRYDYTPPVNGEPFSINTEIAACPWSPKHRLVSVGLQGKIIPTDDLPASNLVFLIDVSGSMGEPNKLPLVQQSLKLLVDQLRAKDRVALVVYAGSAGLVLPSTSGAEKMKIKDAIDRLESGGSTAGGAGIQLAYKMARDNFMKPGNNRIILCSDGDFNVGASSDAALEAMIENERKSGVFLTILGYGMGNYQDAKMQKLAGKGNGNHAYIDNLSEARKVLVKEFGGTLFAIAKDVKLQVEFNPSQVQAYRLVGYENRMLNKEDFNDDLKDAGELGSGHTVTALYEIIPTGVHSEFIKSVDPLRYQQKSNHVNNSTSEIMTIKFRYKLPDGEVSKLITRAVIAGTGTTSDNFRFAAAVAEFGMVLRNSSFKQQSSYENASKLAKGALGDDEEGYRSEFIRLIKNAQDIQNGISTR